MGRAYIFAALPKTGTVIVVNRGNKSNTTMKQDVAVEYLQTRKLLGEISELFKNAPESSCKEQLHRTKTALGAEWH